jgi:NAD(P)-dependent dehydrogenase (short-subunit alcohol dehydrogenase family)
VFGALPDAPRGASPEAPLRGGTGTAVLLGTRFRPADNQPLAEGVRAAVRRGGRLVLVHLGAGGASLIRAAMSENRALRGLSIELPAQPAVAALRTAATLATGDLSTATELRVDQQGRVTGTGWRPVRLPDPLPDGAGPGVAVITGGLGGLGIRAAAVLAQRDRLHPVLVDRRSPDDRPAAVRRYLRCLADGPTGVSVRTADVTVPASAAAALTDLPGPVSVLVHCAGVMCHGPASRYTPVELAEAQAVKVAGLRHILAGTDPARLRSLVVFGSMLADRDPHTLGGYALANELLARAAAVASTGLPHTATVVAQWSIWAGAGMAHDLGVVGQARAMNLVPVALRPGLQALRQLVSGGVTGRLLLLGHDTGEEGKRGEGAAIPGEYVRHGWGWGLAWQVTA